MVGNTHLQISAVGTFQTFREYLTVEAGNVNTLFTFPGSTVSIQETFLHFYTTPTVGVPQFPHYHISVFPNFSIQDTFLHFHTSTVGYLSIQEKKFLIFTLPQFVTQVFKYPTGDKVYNLQCPTISGY